MSLLKFVIKGIDNVGGLFFEETQLARYIVVPESAGGFTIPDPAFPISDRHIQGIQAPGLIPGSRAVIFFRTRHTKTPAFSVRLNATPLTQHTFTEGGPNSWHEIVPPGALKPQDNELTLFVQGDGHVTFSDIVILYTSNKLTVEQPPVLAPF
jgi:hypothetical protein